MEGQVSKMEENAGVHDGRYFAVVHLLPLFRPVGGNGSEQTTDLGEKFVSLFGEQGRNTRGLRGDRKLNCSQPLQQGHQ